MVKAYLAGDMLKRGSQLLRSLEREQIEKLDTVDLFNPMDNKEINDKSKSPTAEMIFEKDTAAMLASDIIIAEIDNNNVGTTSEMGQMWGVNYILEMLHGIVENASKETNKDFRNQMIAAGVDMLLKEIPLKKIYWQTTDIRDTNIPEAGHRRSHSLNQYLHGMMLDMAGEAQSFDEILEELKK